MGVITNRLEIISLYLRERRRYGITEVEGPLGRTVIFIVDGVGGFQHSPLIIRKVLRENAIPIGTILFRWQFGLIGEIWTDLMWLRRNRVMGAKLARKLLAFRRDHPQTTIHLLGFSGGAGIAAFACERLPRQGIIETLILACPALSPNYDLGPALGVVRRCYALISRQDRFVLGLGTQVFGTLDRRFAPAAGQVGFVRPRNHPSSDVKSYKNMSHIFWTPELKTLGHYGGHIGWLAPRFLHRHLVPMIEGRPLLPVHPALDER